MKMIKLLFMLLVVLVEIVFACFEIVTRTTSGLLAIVRVGLMKDYDYRRWLKRDLADCEFILELGCGPTSPILYNDDAYRTDGIDIWPPYVDFQNRKGNYNKCQLGDILDMRLPEKAYDAVVMCDVLEHLPREKVEQIDLLARLERCAIKKVILFTPNGFIENDELDGDPYQKHLSAWEPEDYLQRGYKVVGATGLRWLFGKASLPRYRPYSVCAIIGMITKPFVFHRPDLAWHSYAVKEVK